MDRESNVPTGSPGGGHLGTFAVKPTNTAAFVTKLYTMVEDSAEESITWSSAGDYFKVISPSNFACTVLPKYFKHRNWTSFVRQLNMYGFHKISEYRDDMEQDIWCFKHASFYRGGKHSSHLIRRKRSHASPHLENESPVPQDDIDDEESMLDMELDPKLERLEAALTSMHNRTQIISDELKSLWTSVQKQQQMTIVVVEMLTDVIQKIQRDRKEDAHPTSHDCQHKVYDPVWDTMRCDCEEYEARVNKAARSINEPKPMSSAKRVCTTLGGSRRKKPKNVTLDKKKS